MSLDKERNAKKMNSTNDTEGELAQETQAGSSEPYGTQPPIKDKPQPDGTDLLLELDKEPPKGSKTATIRRLLAYAFLYKKQLLVALIMLSVAVGTDLAGPFIAKRIIDVHISGISKPWYTTGVEGPYTVAYEGVFYKRADHFAANEAYGGEVRVLQVGKDYYFIPEPVKADGLRSMTSEGRISIDSGTNVSTYPARRLNTGELFRFFEPEFGGLIRLCGFYLGLLVVSALFSYGQRYFLQASANRIIRRMRTDVFGQINRLPIRYFDNLPAGKVVSRVTNDTEAIRELYVTVLANFLQERFIWLEFFWHCSCWMYGWRRFVCLSFHCSCCGFTCTANLPSATTGLSVRRSARLTGS